MIYSKEHNKNIKKLFPQYEPLFSTKLIPVLLHLKYWSYDSPYIELPWISHHLYQVLSYPTETPLQPNNHHLLQWFSYFVLPHSTKRHHKYWLYQTIWQLKPIKLSSSYLQIIIPYESNTLLIKKLSLQEPLFLQSKTTWSTTALFWIQSMLNSLRNGRCSFTFRTLLVNTTSPTISNRKPLLYFSQL